MYFRLYNPLMWAVCANTSIAELLLAAGADINYQNKSGVSALMVAAQRLDRKEIRGFPNDKFSKRDSLEMIEFLVRVGGKRDQKDSKGSSLRVV